MAETDTETITVGERSAGPPAADETTAGTPVTLPVVELLTGRGFITGKSGAGKSNTASVVLEDLLANNFPCFILDADGEYYGLKETYEILHAGADEECDIVVSPEHAEKLASLALEENVPIILDISGYLDRSAADRLVRETARHLFAKEKKLKKPFLLVVEEIHEYIPEGGGLDDTGRMLIKIGKRGRKHGLGLLGVSQRPADVKKDFITQANWLVWHRLTWDNDTRVAGRVIGDAHAEAITDLDDGEAFLQTDWTDAEIRRVQFRRKRTFDAGATPGLEDFERPELKSVSEGLLAELEDISDRQERRQDRIEELEAELERKERRIDELERELAQAKTVSDAAEQLAAAIDDGSAVAATADDDLADRIETIETAVETLATRLDSLEAPPVEESADSPTTSDSLGSVLESALETTDTADAVSSSTTSDDPDSLPDIDLTAAFDPWPEALSPSDSDRDDPPTPDLTTSTASPTRSVSTASEASTAVPAALSPAARERTQAAIRAATCPPSAAETVLERLLETAATPDTLADTLEVPTQHVWTLLFELRRRDLATRDANGRYRLATGTESTTDRVSL